MKNKQLTLEQRYNIQALLQINTPKKEIAQAVDTSISTVYREIDRNKHKRGYTANHAQMLSTERKERYHRQSTFCFGKLPLAVQIDDLPTSSCRLCKRTHTDGY
jgi:IS30 family transposase